LPGKQVSIPSHSKIIHHKDIIISNKISPTIFTYSKKTSPQKMIDNINEEIDLSPRTFSKTVQAFSGKQTPY